MYKTKSFYIESLGCAKNQVDSEILINSLLDLGWKQEEDPSVSSFIIVNTCGFIESAKQESIDVLISYRDAFPQSKIIATGCLSQRYPKELGSSMPNIDGILGNKNVTAISELIEKIYSTNTENPLVRLVNSNEISTHQIEKDETYSKTRKVLLSKRGSAYVKIAEGCNNNCSFCAIPLIRGRLKSRKIENIIEEIRNLTENGIKEINLIAQDLGSYGRDINKGKCLLANLLLEAEKIPGSFKIRMLYIHPDNFPLEIIPICAKSKRILHYFDIPFQHASKKILLKMNRQGDSEKYLNLIDSIKKGLPNAVIRTTFMLGFPGETTKDIGTPSFG